MIVTRLKTVDLDVERLEVQSPQNQNKDKFKNLTKTNINVNTELQKEEIYMNENENNYSLILVVRGDTSSSTSQIDRTIAKKKPSSLQVENTNVLEQIIMAKANTLGGLLKALLHKLPPVVK